jgi:hypothetical protein
MFGRIQLYQSHFQLLSTLLAPKGTCLVVKQFKMFLTSTEFVVIKVFSSTCTFKTKEIHFEWKINNKKLLTGGIKKFRLYFQFSNGKCVLTCENKSLDRTNTTEQRTFERNSERTICMFFLIETK